MNYFTNYVLLPITDGSEPPAKQTSFRQNIGEGKANPRFIGLQSVAEISDAPDMPSSTQSMESNAVSKASVVAGAFQHFVGKIGSLGNMEIWNGTSEEMDNRRFYYKATNIVNKVVGKFEELKSMREDLINYILDGRLPEFNQSNYDSKFRKVNFYSPQKEKYVKEVIKFGDALMKDNKIEKQEETKKEQLETLH